MNSYEIEAALPWNDNEQTVLLLSREREWAEAYHAENPTCAMGRVYLEFVQRELDVALSEAE